MNRLRPVWSYVPVVAGPLLLFAPFLLGQRVLYWGTVLLQFYPWRELALQALRSGHLPLWDPLLGNGAPLLANYQSAVFYPPNWLALLVPLDYAQAWIAALHLVWAGVGMVTLARALGLPPLGQAVAGLAFGLSQYLVARVSFFSINAAVAWLPWMVWLAERQLRLGTIPASATSPAAGAWPRLSTALLMAACVGLLLLAGHAQTAWYILLLAGAWCAWRLLSPGAQGFGPRLRTAVWLAAPAGLGAILAAVQLLPTAELLRESPRAVSADFDFVMTYSFSPWRLMTLVAPDLLGNPARGQFFGYGNYWEDAIYVGVLPLLLAITTAGSSLAALVRRRRGQAEHYNLPGLPIFLIALMAVSLLLGLGRNTAVFPFLYWHVPTFNLFQAPTRMMIWFVFALALLAGMGAAAWRAPQGWALYWTRLGTAGALAMAVVGFGSWLLISPATQTGLHMRSIGGAFALAGLLLFASGLLSLMRPAGSYPYPCRNRVLPCRNRVLSSRAWILAVLLVTGADLLYAGYGLNPGAPPDLYRRPAAPAQLVSAALQGHRLFYYPSDEYDVKYGRLVSFKSFGPPDLAYAARDALLADANVLDGVASANNFDPLVSARYAGLMQVISATHSLPLLRLMDVGIVASAAPMSLDEIATSPASGMRFYRVPGQPQRVWSVAHTETVADGPAALRALADPTFDPTSTVILEADDTSPTARQHPATLSSDAITFPVTLGQDGWVVLADTYYPGWAAWVDGVPANIRHADYAFRGVAVPAGSHTIVFDYQPGSLMEGSLLTILGALAGLVLGLAGWIYGRRFS